jgi:hypothetical protein
MKFKSKPVKVEQRRRLPASEMSNFVFQSGEGFSNSVDGFSNSVDGFSNSVEGFSNSVDEFSNSTESIVAAAVRSLSPLPPSGLVSCGLRLNSPTFQNSLTSQHSPAFQNSPTFQNSSTSQQSPTFQNSSTPQTFLNIKPDYELLSPAVSPPSSDFSVGQILMTPNFGPQTNANSKISDFKMNTVTVGAALSDHFRTGNY